METKRKENNSDYFKKGFGKVNIASIFALPKSTLGLQLKCRLDSVAQLVEHYTFNVGVLGSNPSGITKSLQIYDLKAF